MKNPIVDILLERMRVVTEEGFSNKDDDRLTSGQLRWAAASYCGPVWRDFTTTNPPVQWPADLDPSMFKPEGNPADPLREPRRDLVKAGQLILAEIERIDRKNGVVHDDIYIFDGGDFKKIQSALDAAAGFALSNGKIALAERFSGASVLMDQVANNEPRFDDVGDD